MNNNTCVQLLLYKSNVLNVSGKIIGLKCSKTIINRYLIG